MSPKGLKREGSPRRLTSDEVLARVPQQTPFRFIDEIREISDEHVVSSYRYRLDEFFYRGHFLSDPVTPGVILLETMAQTALVALGIYLLCAGPRGVSELSARQRTLFTEAQVEFFEIVRPGTQVIVRGEREFWRRSKLRSRVVMHSEIGTLIAEGTVAGIGVSV